jgi:hypothetical protein
MAMKVIDQANVVPQTGLEPVTPSLRIMGMHLSQPFPNVAFSQK